MLQHHMTLTFILGGSDFDFYDIKPRIKSVDGYVISETHNALTVNINGQVVAKVLLVSLQQMNWRKMMSDRMYITVASFCLVDAIEKLKEDGCVDIGLSKQDGSWLLSFNMSCKRMPLENDGELLPEESRLSVDNKSDKPDVSDELKSFLARWENAVCEIRERNKASDNNMQISHLCDKLESSMAAYRKGNIEYAHFAI